MEDILRDPIDLHRAFEAEEDEMEKAKPTAPPSFKFRYWFFKLRITYNHRIHEELRLRNRISPAPPNEDFDFAASEKPAGEDFPWGCASIAKPYATPKRRIRKKVFSKQYRSKRILHSNKPSKRAAFSIAPGFLPKNKPGLLRLNIEVLKAPQIHERQNLEMRGLIQIANLQAKRANNATITNDPKARPIDRE